MKIAIIGSRGYPDLTEVSDYVFKLTRNDVVISGGARGVDSYAEMAAKQRRISRVIFEARCEDDASAYVSELHARNERIIRAADKVVAFHDGESHGTLAALAIAKRLEKRIEMHVRRRS